MGKTLDEMLAQLTPERRQRVEGMTQQMMLETHLYQLREAQGMTQMDLAKQMNITQPTIVAIEKRGNDLKLLTLKRYVEALGGKMRIEVDLPCGKHVGFDV